MKLKPLAYAVVAAGAATSNLTWGTENANENVDTMVVSASRVTESIASIPYTTQVVEGADIQRQAQPGRNLGQILGQIVPGLAPGDDSATSFYQSLRGRKVLVLIDGVAQRQSRDISRQLTTISPENIERVEIISGATAVYGAGATGGVINIITKRGLDQETRFNTKVGMTFNTEEPDSDGFTYFASQSVAGQASDSVDFLVNLNYETRGNYYDSEGDQIATDPNQVSRDNSDTIDFFTNIGWQIDEDMSLRVGLEYFKEEQDTDYAADFGEPDPSYFGLPEGLFATGGAYTPTPKDGLKLDDQPQSTRQSITFDFNHQDIAGHTLLTQLSIRENEYYFYPYPSVPIFIGIDWQGVIAAAPTTPVELLTAAAANIEGATGTLFQSRVNSDVIDFKLALDKAFDLDGKALNVTYGMDYIIDESEQRSIVHSYNDWVSSGQTEYNPSGDVYDAGPASKTKTAAIFTQFKLLLDEKWTLKAGLRYEKSKVEVDNTTSGIDIVNAQYYNEEVNDIYLQALAGGSGIPAEMILESVTSTAATALDIEELLIYTNEAKEREGGTKTYSEVLFNAGAVYAFTPNQEAFINYSEGFDVPDMTRLLRSVTVLSDGGDQGPILEGTNVDAVKTDSYDIGWRGRFEQLSAQASLFYNESDKNVEFDSNTGVVTIRDQEERFWGVEALMDYNFNNGFQAGATYSRTYGETKNDDGDWEYLEVDRVAPEKLTGYVAHAWGRSADARLQFTHTSDYKKADVPFEGFRTFDLITTFYTDVGDFSAAIRNLTNAEYYSLYNQIRGKVTGGASAYLPAQGRTFSLSYSLDY